MPDRENRSWRPVVFIVTCLLHGGILFILIHAKPNYRSLKAADQSITIFLVKPQPAITIALPKQSVLEALVATTAQEHLLDSGPPLPDVSVPPVDNQTSEDPANIDWAAEAQRTAASVARSTGPGSSDSPSASAGSAPWNPHPGRLERSPEGLKLRIIDPCFALFHNLTHDPLLGTKEELQLNCKWKKPPPRGDLFDSIRRPPLNK
jgi:hypothetical protein